MEETPVMTLGLQPPKGYKIEDAEAWKKYKQMFNLYIQATDLEQGTDEKKVAIFLTCAGEDILEIYNGMSDTSTLKWAELLKKFDDHFKNKTNTVVNSYRFYNLRQEPDEPVERFVLRLKNAAKTCNFKEEDRMVRDMLVIGVSETGIKERLLREKELSLDTALELCKAAEYSKKNVKELEEKVQSVNMVRESSRYRKDVKKPIHYNCSYCGKKHEPRKCPAYGRRCTVCNIYNHYAEMCRFKKKEEKPQQKQRSTKNKVDGIRESTNDSDCSSEDFVVDSVKVSSQY
ncbi:uncharacterized protein LOC134802285 [Cydia splendana]|uniref:uncharacterized protein LOC134790120 n=1 Tax=Cydia splendana TaxID=1100963 RepID=UPI00300CAE2A